MPLLAQATVAVLLLPTALTPPAGLVWAHAADPGSPMAPVAAAPATVVAPAAATVVAPAAATVVAPAGSTVVVADGWDAVAAPTQAVTTTTTTTTSTTTTTVPVATTNVTVAAPAPVISPQVAVRTLLRYDPYLAPRYRSGRNLMIGGGVTLGIGTLTLLSSLSWLRHERSAREADVEISGLDRSRRVSISTVGAIAVAAAVLTAGGIVMLATGAVRRRKAIEEARGRVYMQAGPGGMQVRF